MTTMTNDHDHDQIELKSRLIGFIQADETTHIQVDYLYDNETCPEHGGLAHGGLVGIVVHHGEPGEEQLATALLDATDALLLADRITRAAHLALEVEEDLPDIEHESLRFSERP
jgi:hypothetical protein